MMLPGRGVYAMREWSCWCPACSCVRGRGRELGTESEGRLLRVPSCTHSKLTVWREDQFTVTPKAGYANRKKRLAELWAQLEPKISPGKYGCVQVRELWGESEERHYRPGHHWVFEFGDAGDGTYPLTWSSNLRLTLSSVLLCSLAHCFGVCPRCTHGGKVYGQELLWYAASIL